MTRRERSVYINQWWRHRSRHLLACLVLLSIFVHAPAHADEQSEASASELPELSSEPPALSAEKRALGFGQLPAFRRPRLSPNGSRAVMIVQPGDVDMPVAVVHEFASKKSKIVLASEEDEFDLQGCRFANDDRLLCRFFGVAKKAWFKYGNTRLVAVDADGSGMRVLMQDRLQRKLEGTRAYAQFQDRITDWLPDEPGHVLIEEPDERGSGLSKLDIQSGHMGRVIRPRPFVHAWITDAEPEARLRLKIKDGVRTWEHRDPGGSGWDVLERSRAGDDDGGFSPVGFGDDRDRLLSLRNIDGRQALVSEDVVGDGERITVFAHDEVDVVGVQTFGPHDRVVAAIVVTDRPQIAYFDASLERVHATVKKALPGKAIFIGDESWDRQVYLIFAYSDVDPGAWYRLDLAGGELSFISYHRPALRSVEMSPTESITHVAADGVEIRGYLTRPIGAPEGPLPTIVLPDGGPESRDVSGFDWLAQYFAANGYAVLRTTYRGGYSGEWGGDGPYQSWRQVVSDIDTRLQHLIDAGVTDPERVCTVGWNFGGYAALLSAIEHPGRYRCVVDIAGVSDPELLVDQYDGFAIEDWVDAKVSRSKDVLQNGSPLKRAKEIQAPVLIFHADEDLNVDVKQGRKLAKALRKAGKTVEYVEYEDDEHSIVRHGSRIDMLKRIGVFLEEHLAKKPVESAATQPAN